MEQKELAIREQQWCTAIVAAKRSGQNIKMWCAENGSAPSTFYKWQRKLQDKALTQKQQPEFQGPLPPKPSKGTPTVNRIAIRIQDTTAELPADMTAAQICELIRGIRHAG